MSRMIKGWKCARCGREYYEPEDADACCPRPVKQEEEEENHE